MERDTRSDCTRRRRERAQRIETDHPVRGVYAVLPLDDGFVGVIFLLPMATPARRRRPAVTPSSVTQMQRSLDECTEEIARLRREIETHIRRMATMQAEIDRLRERIDGVRNGVRS